MSFDFLNNLQPAAPITQTSDLTKLLVCELTPGAYDGLIKIITILQDYGTIVIENSKITQALSQSTSILTCDISNIIGPNINLHILNPKNSLKKFKGLDNVGTIRIEDDPAMKRYIVRGKSANKTFPKQIENVVLENSMPELPNAQIIGSGVIFAKEEIKSIMKFISSSDEKSTNIVIKNNVVVGFHKEDDGCYKFGGGELDFDETTVDLSLKSYTFFLFEPESAEMFLALNDDGKYWLMTKMNIGYATISIFENLQNSKEQQLII